MTLSDLIFIFHRGCEVTIDTFFDRMHPDDRDRIRESIEANISQHQPYDIDYRTVSPDGKSIKWIRAAGSTLYDDTGKPIRFSGITMDVTDRVLAQEELQASEQALAIGSANRQARRVGAGFTNSGR